MVVNDKKVQRSAIQTLTKNIAARSLTSFLCSCGISVWSTTTWMWINAATAVIFSKQCFLARQNSILYWETYWASIVLHIFCQQPFNEMFILMCLLIKRCLLTALWNVYPVAVTTIFLMSFYIAVSKENVTSRLF